MIVLLTTLFDMPPWGDAFDAEEPPPGPADNPGAFLYEEGTIHDFYIDIAPDQEDDLRRNGPDVHATLTYEGVSWEVGLHLKGSSTYTSLGGKASFKIDIGQWVDHQTLLGVRRLTFNAMKFDPTMMREHVAYRLFKRMGVPAPRHGYARVWVNGEAYGLYGIVESMDEQFIRRNWPADSEGHLYDTTFNYADLTGLGKGSFVVQEGDPATADEDINQLVSELDRENILEVLETHFDRDEILAMLAVDLATGNWDCYTRNTNNYLLYHAPLEDKWHMIPWGQDMAFQGGGSLYMGVRGRLASQCAADSECRDALDQRARDVLTEWEDGDLLGFAKQTWATIGTACEDDPRRGSGCKPDDIFNNLEDRPGALWHELQ